MTADGATVVARRRDRTVGLLIAAGFGRRFDPTGRRSKLEQPIGDAPVAIHTARALAAGCSRLIAVVRPETTALIAALTAQGCRIALVDGPEGMGHSIACGAIAAQSEPDVDAILIQPADMPWLTPATVVRIADADLDDAPIVLPVRDGLDGHPVRFAHRLLPELALLAGERGARVLLARHPVLRLPVTDPGAFRDIDRPEDLNAPTHPGG